MRKWSLTIFLLLILLCPSMAWATYSISGTITYNGSALVGATVSYTGTSSGSVTTDGSGNYSITGLSAGSYTITPSYSSLVFNPGASYQTVSNQNITSVNFTAAFAYFLTTGNANGSATGNGQFLPRSINPPSNPSVLGSFTDEYGMTVRRITGGTTYGTAPAYYPTRSQSMENSDGTMFVAQLTQVSVYSIFDATTGAYQLNLSQFELMTYNGASEGFNWSTTDPNVAYFFTQADPNTTYGGANVAKIWKITIDRSGGSGHWTATGKVLHSFSLTEPNMPTCPPGETFVSLIQADEGPTSWDGGRYRAIGYKCSEDTPGGGDNSVYAITLLDMQASGFDGQGDPIPGLLAYTTMPSNTIGEYNRVTYAFGVSPGGGYWMIRTDSAGHSTQIGNDPPPCSFPTGDGMCIKSFPVATARSQGGYIPLYDFVQINGYEGVSIHWCPAYDEDGDEVYVGIDGQTCCGYQIFFHKFSDNRQHRTYVTGSPFAYELNGNFHLANSDPFYATHIAVAGVTGGTYGGPQSWIAWLPSSDSPGAQLGYEQSVGTDTISFVHISTEHPAILRVVHERAENPCAQFGVPGRTPERYYFQSNWEIYSANQDLYRVELPANWWVDAINQNSSISGTIYSTTNSNTVAGVTISYTGPVSGSVTSIFDGTYATPTLPPGNYTITPSLSGHTFSPSSASETVVAATPIRGVNFTTAIGSTYSVSGAIPNRTYYPSPGEWGIPTTTLTITGPVNETTGTLWDGSFNLGGLPNGVYTITPSATVASGYIYSPSSRTITINGGGVSDVNFTANQGTVFSCGSASGGTTSSMPSSNLCNSPCTGGSVSGPTNNQYLWSCTYTNYITASCTSNHSSGGTGNTVRVFSGVFK